MIKSIILHQAPRWLDCGTETSESFRLCGYPWHPRRRDCGRCICRIIYYLHRRNAEQLYRDTEHCLATKRNCKEMDTIKIKSKKLEFQISIFIQIKAKKERRLQIMNYHILYKSVIGVLIEILQLVVVVVYLTTNQRHMGYLSSGNGHLAGRWYPKTNLKPLKSTVRQTPFCSATPYSPHFGTPALKLQRHWILPRPSRLIYVFPS